MPAIVSQQRFTAAMNDFLRPCSCVHPSEEDCKNASERWLSKSQRMNAVEESVPVRTNPRLARGTGIGKPTGLEIGT